MNFASSLCPSDVTIPLFNKVLPSAHKTATITIKNPLSATCTEIPDEEDELIKNYLPTPNGELLLPVDDSEKPSLSHIPLTDDLPLDDTLRLLSSKNFSVPDSIALLCKWSHISRSRELNESLVHTLNNVSPHLASQILSQLKEPITTLRTVELGQYKDK